jgi:hypothetical protein
MIKEKGQHHLKKCLIPIFRGKEKCLCPDLNVCVPIFWGGVFCSQILIVSRLKPFYFLGLGLFYLLIFCLFYSLWQEVRLKQNILLPLLLGSIFLLRLPFFFYPRGLIFTSDNALDALQTQEIATTHLAPYFLLGALHHMGTTKYTLAAYLWTVFGSHYLLYTIIQVSMYAVMLICLYFIFKSITPEAPLFLLLLSGFSFIETMFDNSLSLRAGSEFEMACFFLIGAALFDSTFSSRWRFFLSSYFIFFSIYLHTLGAALALALIFAAAFIGLLTQPKERLFRLLWPSLAGAFLGLFHWIYYLLFVPRTPSLGGWEKINWRLPGRFSWNLLQSLAENVKSCFLNLFSFEFNYLIDFFQEREKRGWLLTLNQATIIISALVFLLAILFSLKQAWHFILKKERRTSLWPSIFFLFLLAAFLAKNFLLEPPLLEPRHNFDLLLLVLLAYFIALNSLFTSRLQLSLKLKKIWPAPASPAALSSLKKKASSFLFIIFLSVLFLFTLPHYYYYFKMTQHKEILYKELLATLKKNRVRYLATDFILAYPIHFLSGRKILVSDSIGPLTIPQFFPDMRAAVDKIPPEKKAYLFFAEEYPSRPWHKKATSVIKTRLLNDFQKKGIAYRIIKIRYFVLILPRKVEGQTALR